MSLLARIRRAAATLSVPSLEPGVLYGQQGEDEVGRIIDQIPGSFRLANPIVPHAHTGVGVLEADHLVYVYGTLFCVEVKRWKNCVLTRKDQHTIISAKVGNYGERLDPLERRDPLKQVQTFIYHLKRDLCAIDARFQRERLVAVAVFFPETDIRAVYDFEAGFITVADLPRFFAHHKHPRFPGKPAPWIVQTLNWIYTWDVIETTRQERWKGLLTEKELHFRGPDGLHHLPLQTVRRIQMQRSGIFSAFDMMRVEATNGSTETLACESGELHLDLPGSQVGPITHKLRNVRTIVIGVANKQ